MHRCVRIEDVRREARDVVSILFRDPCIALPGQFYMVWLPGHEEVPMSVSFTGMLKGITVRAVGPTTRALHSLEADDRLWIRGPYGRCYSIRGSRPLVVAGGTGIASLAPLVEEHPGDVLTLLGARTSEDLFFVERLRASSEVWVSTDDGSEGHAGPVTDLLERAVEEHEPDIVYTCGPEAMMVKVYAFASERDIAVEASLERYMKCGIGICDSCSVSGYRVCRDGPVFSDELTEIYEFGRFRRDPSGRRVPI
jgi:dihydroorotate dehydrogenase electron transfer subunit